jgi:indole-3-glycerol phosphate synthase
MLSGVEDRLSLLVRNARELVDCGFYADGAARHCRGDGCGRPSLAAALRGSADFPIVAEVKLASPTAGRLGAHVAEELIEDYRSGGAAALSVITEPRYFLGSLRYLELAARTGIPVMMKDFVVDAGQLEAASRLGASAVLLIQGVFDTEHEVEREELIETAHRLGLEVVLESSSLEELDSAVSSQADILAFNRRDLRTFRPGPDAMAEALELMGTDGRPALAMSMLDCYDDVRRMRDLGATGVLIGSALSGSPCPREKLLSLRMPR